MIKIGIDIDDVCWNLVGNWIYAYNSSEQESGCSITEPLSFYDIKTWDIASYVPKQKRDKLFSILRLKSLWDSVALSVTKEKYDIIKEIYEDSRFDVYFVTNSNPATCNYKIQRFLDIYDFVDENSIILCKDKWLLSLDVMIEDNVDTLNKFNPHLTKCFLIDKPWNDYYAEDNVIRCDNVEKAIELIYNEWGE